MEKHTKDRDQLFRELAGTMGQVFALSNETLSEEVTTQLAGLLSALDIVHKKTVYKLDGVGEQINNLTGSNELLENAIELNQKLSAEFYNEQVVLPLARSLFPVIDLIHEAQATLDTNEPRYRRALQYLIGLHTQIAQFLSSYGIDLFRHDTEEKFNPKLMQPIKKEPTGDQNLTGCIAASLQCGFRKDERILRLEKVSLYKH
jgi:molecular chaperone GrpE (heat shock protein)